MDDICKPEISVSCPPIDNFSRPGSHSISWLNFCATAGVEKHRSSKRTRYPKNKGLPTSNKPLKFKYYSWLLGLDLNQRSRRGGIMSLTSPLRLWVHRNEFIERMPDKFAEALAPFLFLQLKLPFSRSPVVRKLFYVKKSPWTESCSPFGNSFIMLFESMGLVFTDSNVESARRAAPYNLQEEWLIGYPGHCWKWEGPSSLSANWAHGCGGWI